MKRTSLVIAGIAVIVAGFVLIQSVFTVHQTQQSLVLQFGNPIRVERDPGLKFKLPWQSVETYDKRILDLDPPAQEVLLSDQKRINVDSFARYRITDPLEFKKRAVTDANFRDVFGGRINSAVRSEVAKVSLADMLSQTRAKVMDRIASLLRPQAVDFGVELVDLRIGRTDLPDATSQAVYNRMRSERVAQAAELRAMGAEQKARIQAGADRERTVILADANKRSQELRGEGDGERTNILSEAYGRDPEFFDFYRSLESYSALKGDGTSLVLSPDSDFFRFFWNEMGQQERPSSDAR